MKQLTEIKVIRFSASQWQLLQSLKRYRINHTDFIRIAITEKLERDLPKLIDKQRKEEINKCPF